MSSTAPSPDCSGWQPIETAPRDGTEIDLWVVKRFVREADRNDAFRVADVAWREYRPDEFGWTARGGYLAETDFPGGCRFATHWMPIPPGPEAA